MKKLFFVALLLLQSTCAWAITKVPAKDVTVDASSFSGNLSTSDTDVQKALVTVNGLSILHPNAPITAGTHTKITYDANGLVTGGVDATTTDIPEGTNLYYTDARARAALSASSPATYNSTTGVIGVQAASALQNGYLSSADYTNLHNQSGTNTGDVTLSGENYLSISGQAITAHPVDLSGTNATGTLAAGRFPALTGDVTTSAGSLATTISNQAVTYGKIQNVSANNRLLGRSTLGAGSVEEITPGTNLSISGGSLSITSGDMTDTGTDGITVTSGTGSVLGSGTSLAQHVADSTHNGYLSSGDWSAFNGKVTDPGSHTTDTILGWDNTDAAFKNFTIGTNLSYNHATHTLSATGGGGGTPGGANTDVQFNDSGAFGGNAGFLYDKSTDHLSLGSAAAIQSNETFYIEDAITSNSPIGIDCEIHDNQSGPGSQYGIAMYGYVDDSGTNDPGSLYGGYFVAKHTSSVNVSLIDGVYALAHNDGDHNASIRAMDYLAESNGSGTNPQAIGVYGEVDTNNSANTTVTAAGLFNPGAHSSTGTIGTAYGIQIPAMFKAGGAGTITTLYGIYLADQTVASTNYNLYSAGSGAENYFEGNVGIGTLTASTALVSDASKNIVSSSTTSTELGFVHGVTSAIQTQIDGKLGSVTADSPLSGSGTSGSHLVIANAAADGSTLGAAAFTAADFNSSSGVISIDYTNGQKASSSQPGFSTANQTIATVGVGMDGGGSTLTTGVKGYVTVPYAGTISAWSITADGASPTCTIDIWKVATGTALPTVANTIINTGAGGAKPALSTGNAIHSTNVAHWTTSVAANDIIGFNLDAVTTATRITLTLEVDKS